MDSYIKDVRLTPEIDKMQVDNELDDLHSGQVLLPLKNIESVCVTICPCRIIARCDTHPYLRATGSRVIVVVCNGL